MLSLSPASLFKGDFCARMCRGLAVPNPCLGPASRLRSQELDGLNQQTRARPQELLDVVEIFARPDNNGAGRP